MNVNAIRICGIDPAKMRDAFGLVVIDIINQEFIRVIAAKQWKRREYLEIEKEVNTICNKLGIQAIFLEVNNTGTHVFEVLRRFSLPLYPITTVSNITDIKKIQKGRSMSKSDIVAFSLNLLQEGKLLFPEKPKSADMLELIRQFGVFQESITPAGKPTYSAPSGSHDDLVMALLLGIHGSRKWLRSKHPFAISNQSYQYEFQMQKYE